jgi:starch-binding outer membrane protein, SusD/RagB family
MKRTIITITLITFFIASCDKKLDLLPQQSVAEEVALNSDGNVKKVLNGAYDAISSGNLYGGNMQLYSELLGANGEIRWEGTFNQPREIWSKAMLKTNSFISATWLSAYSTINVANNIISAIPVVIAADQNRVKGEALFIRGCMYFELVKLFAKPYSAGSVTTNLGVPMILTPTRGIDANSYVPRSTVEQTYTQIIADLTEAEGLLPAINPGSNATTRMVYATSAAAAAMLSRVYLQMERWADARDAANRSITVATANTRALATTYAGAFNNTVNSAEYLFAMQISAQDGANNMHLYWSIPTYGGRDGDVSVQAPHLALYDPADARRALFYTGASATRSGKWQLQYRVLPIIRLAEMYLTRAEANFRAGTTTGSTPVADVNRTRQRAGLLPLVTVTLAEILAERKLELAHEGHEIHDRKRLRLTTDGFAYNADKIVFPIPQREVDASGGIIVQNSGY